MTIKPLFIPLTGEAFDAFANGDKRVEYRKLGGRWNRSICAVGRPVVLSRGYSGARLAAKILAVGVERARKGRGLDTYGRVRVIALTLSPVEPLSPR